MISHHLLIGRVIVPYGGNLYHVVKDLRQTGFGGGNTRCFTSYIQATRVSGLWVLYQARQDTCLFILRLIIYLRPRS